MWRGTALKTIYPSPLTCSKSILLSSQDPETASRCSPKIIRPSPFPLFDRLGFFLGSRGRYPILLQYFSPSPAQFGNGAQGFPGQSLLSDSDRWLPRMPAGGIASSLGSQLMASLAGEVAGWGSQQPDLVEDAHCRGG